MIALNGVGANDNLESRGLSVKIIRIDSSRGQEFSIKAKYSNAKIVIKAPQLWWPNGLGDPHVYEFQVILLKGKQVLDKKKIVYGLRTV